MAISSEVEKLERRWNENPSGLTFAPLAEAYRKAGNLPRALEILEVGLVVHPDYIPALIVRGRCYLDAANLMEAEVAFQQVLARDPANAIALRGMADLCERGGRMPEAIERLELLLEVDRSDGEARADLARLKSTPVVTPPEPLAGSPPIGTTSWSEPMTEWVAITRSDETVEPAAVSPMAPDASEETPFRIENLSVDPMVAEDEPDASRPEARLPWEPLEMPGWGQPAPEPLEAVVEASAPEEQGTEGQTVASSGDALLEGLMTVSDLPAAGPPDEPPEPLPAQVWDWGVVAAPARPGQASPGAEAVSDGAAAFPEDERPDAVIVAEEAAAAVVASEPAAMVVVAEWSTPEAGEAVLADARPAGADPVPGWGEVAPEAMASESHVMSHPIPPESPEAAELPWPAVAEVEEEAAPPPVAGLDDPEPVDAPPVAEEGTVAEAADEPALIVTESMAELFLRQGHRELSLAVYRQLLERSPSSESLLQAIARLEIESAARVAAAPVADRPSRAANETGGEPVGAMLLAVLSSPPPVSASTVLPPAIEPVAAGEPTRPGTEPLTLGQVFGDDPSVPPPAMETEPRPAGEPSFDEFFGAPSAGADATTLPGGSRAPEGEDMRQFTGWLKGLKR